MSKKNAETVKTDLPCRICGSFIAYRSNYKCVDCSKRRAYERSNDERRQREGLKPTVGGKARAARRELTGADRALRDLAQCCGEARYRSLLTCKRGHREPDRYTSTGGCVPCAAAASRRQYSKIRKG